MPAEASDNSVLTALRLASSIIFSVLAYRSLDHHRQVVLDSDERTPELAVRYSPSRWQTNRADPRPSSDSMVSVRAPEAGNSYGWIINVPYAHEGSFLVVRTE